MGVAVSSRLFSTPEMESLVTAEFNQITAENIMKMSYMHPEEDTYSFNQADQLVNWAEANGIGVHGHTFIWHSDYQVPGWMKTYSGDFGAMLDTHVTTVAEHFAGRVDSWDVVNEVLADSPTPGNCWRDSLFYQKMGKDFVANAFRAARAADTTADLYYNDFNTEGVSTAKLSCLLEMVDELIAGDVPITGVGFQMHVQINSPSASTIGNTFKAIADRGLKVKITELEIPVNNPYNSAVDFPEYSEFTATAAQRQKQRYKDIMTAYLDNVPAELRGGFTVWGVWDGDSWIMTNSSRYASANASDWPLLFGGPENGPYEAKPAYYGLIEALTDQ